jgi:hypothetical protein
MQGFTRVPPNISGFRVDLSESVRVKEDAGSYESVSPQINTYAASWRLSGSEACIGRFLLYKCVFVFVLSKF